MFVCFLTVCVCVCFRGFYPKGGGEVVVTVNPVKELQPITMMERGNITKIHGRAFVAGVLPFKVNCSLTQLRWPSSKTATFTCVFVLSWPKTCQLLPFEPSGRKSKSCTLIYSRCRRKTTQTAMATASCKSCLSLFCQHQRIMT